jgi:hypothetical protein
VPIDGGSGSEAHPDLGVCLCNSGVMARREDGGNGEHERRVGSERLEPTTGGLLLLRLSSPPPRTQSGTGPSNPDGVPTRRLSVSPVCPHRRRRHHGLVL